MPIETVRNYAASVARLRDPRVTMVMRGFVGGMTIDPADDRLCEQHPEGGPYLRIFRDGLPDAAGEPRGRSPPFSALRHRKGAGGRLCPGAYISRCGIE